MQPVLTIFRTETARFVHSLVAYVALAVFLLGTGLFVWVFPGNLLETGLADLQALFTFGPWLLLLLVPALTMRSFADEFRSGTFEWLATRPVTDWQVLLGKYLAVVALVLLALLPTLLYVVSIAALGNPPGSYDSGATWGAYLGLLLTGACFAAIGIWTSTLTDNQVVAFLMAAFACFVLWQGFGLASELVEFLAVNDVLLLLGIQAHYDSISRGVVDLRDLVYFGSVIGFFLFLSRLALAARKS